MVGGAETMEYFRQTDLLIENWSDLLSTIDRHVEPDVGHIDLIDRLASHTARCSSASSTG
jgi:hypothetical protein